MRVLRRRCRLLLVAGGVGLCLVIAVAPSALGQSATMHAAGSSVPVRPCPVIPEPGFPTPPVPPKSLVLPPSVTLPPGAAVYGADEDYGNPSSRTTFSIGPAGLHCTVAEGADGGFTVALAASSRGVPSVEYTYSTGGVGTGPPEACPYFSALVSIAGGAGCTRPVGAMVTQIPTGQPHLWAATIVDAPGVPLFAGASPSIREALNVMVASTELAQFAICALPPGQRQVCLAGLDYFVTQTIAAQAGASTVAAIQAGIANMAGRPRSSRAVAEADCHADVDVSLDDEIGRSKPFPIPADLVDLPEVQGQVSVSLVLEDGAVCDSRLTPFLNTPVLYNGDLSLGATLSGGAKRGLSGGAKRGPFVYSADSARWTSTPGAPAGQQLVTRFNLLSVSASVDPKLSLAFRSSGEPEPALDLASVSISAFKLEVTLVRQSGALLQVGLGPTLEFTAQIAPREVQEEVEDGESEGLPSGAIDVDVADRLGANTAIGFDEAATEFYGLDISAEVSQALAQEVAGNLLTAIDSDPLLGAFTPADPDDFPADDQPVDSDVTAADGAAMDADTLAGGDITVDAIDLLLAF
jgi:hypothetical protein